MLPQLGQVPVPFAQPLLESPHARKLLPDCDRIRRKAIGDESLEHFLGVVRQDVEHERWNRGHADLFLWLARKSPEGLVSSIIGSEPDSDDHPERVGSVWTRARARESDRTVRSPSKREAGAVPDETRTEAGRRKGIYTNPMLFEVIRERSYALYVYSSRSGFCGLLRSGSRAALWSIALNCHWKRAGYRNGRKSNRLSSAARHSRGRGQPWTSTRTLVL